MNIVDFTTKFQKIEIENKFFEAKNSKGLLYWDIVRHDIFYFIYYELTAIKNSGLTTETSGVMFLLKKHYNNLIGLIWFNIITQFKNYKYLFFIASRNKDNQGKGIDHACDDALMLVHKESLVIESYRELDQLGKYNSVFDYGLLFENYRWRFFKLFNNESIASDYEVSKVLKEGFNINSNLDAEISKILFNYSVTKAYYTKLFKRVKPKAIFLVQNGIQKGLFSAANNLNIPTVEMQHGFVGYVHPAYSYSKSIKVGDLTTVPNFFFSFSSFWSSKINYPVKNIVAIGNSHYSAKVDTAVKKYDLTFIFANIYVTDLLPVVSDLLKIGYMGTICIKLHPNQVNALVSIKNIFVNNKNVYVLANEVAMSDVLSCSKSIVAIQSTGVYEALHYGLKVFIIKVKDYLTHQDIFDNPNVYLIEGINQIIDLSDNKFISSEENTMFADFKKEKFLKFLEKL
jgi:hypothetical protein